MLLIAVSMQSCGHYCGVWISERHWCHFVRLVKLFLEDNENCDDLYMDRAGLLGT